MAITIRHIAKKANVSISTVSRVLNGRDRVKDETREKVLSIINEMSFVTNFSAKSLRGVKTNTIGVIIPDISTLFYSEMVKGIENKLSLHNYRLVLCDSQNNIEKQRSFIKFLYDGMIEGLILVMPTLHQAELLKIKNDGFPLVVVGHNTKKIGIPSISLDNKLGAYKAVKHLRSHGYSKIAFMGNRINEYDFTFDYQHHDYERLEGYQKALQDCKLEYVQEYVVNGRYCEEDAIKAFVSLLNLKNPPDAIFCANDEMALGVLKTALAHNIRIPQDLGLIGFDDIRICAYTNPSITSVNAQMYNMGVETSNKLLHIMKHKDAKMKSANIIIKPELILRRSCGC